MRLRKYQIGELIGIVMVLTATAAQLFYLEPLRREIEWRLATFSIQQSGQIQTRATFDTRIALLQALKQPAEQIKDAEAERDRVAQQFKTADANIADYLLAKGDVETIIQTIVVALFVIGTLLTAIGRAMEMRRSL